MRLAIRIGVMLLSTVLPAPVVAASMETLHEALARAYVDNPSLNSVRAEQRAIDEGVPQALAGFRPTITASASAQLGRTRSQLGTDLARQSSISLSLEQPLYRGNRTRNSLKIAEIAVLAGRESLRNTEQDILLDAVTAYMDVMRDRAVVGLNAQNVESLRGELRGAEERLAVGEGTKTDVAQANARVKSAELQYLVAVAALAGSEAVFNQVIGSRPGNLAAARPISRLLPSNMEEAIHVALTGHPAVLSALHNADVASFNVKVAEGALLPTASLFASLSRTDTPDSRGSAFSSNAAIGARLNVPLYNGGLPSSQVREAKERLSYSRIQIDVVRAQIRALVTSTYGQLDAASEQVVAARAQLLASQTAFDGIQEERDVGQRTILDVLNAQQEVLAARIALVRAQREHVVSSYAALAATGRLTAERLALRVTLYEPEVHYEAVRDQWMGLRTPGGQ